MSALLSLEEAWERLLALVPETGFTTSGGPSPMHRFLAQDLVAQRTQPPADLSAMDGYAIRGDGPWTRIGESRAGHPFTGALEPGQCTRISTGAHLPAGADRVLIQEDAEVSGDTVRLSPGEAPPAPFQHVRKRGFDFASGDTVLPKGTFMGPAQQALAMAAGHDGFAHRSPPVTAILDSGDELVKRAADCGPDGIPASNGPMIAAMLRPWIGKADPIGPVPDDLEALARALESADGAHILITSGGASVGDHDHIQQALREWGAQIAFWKIAVKPGKPLMVATRNRDWGRQVILGLPGNPVSSFVTAFLFALPLVRAAIGDPDPLPKALTMTTAQDLPATGNRREFLRAVSAGSGVRLAGSQDSSALRALALADCLIDRPAGSGPVKAGDEVRVYNLQNG